MKQLLNIVRIMRLLRWLTICTLLASLTGSMGKYAWFADLFSHFRQQYWLIFFIVGGLALWKKHQQLLMIAMLGLLLETYQLWVPEPTQSPTIINNKNDVAMQLLSYNVNAYNQQPHDILPLLQQAAADVILIVEATPNILQALSPLTASYPYQLLAPQTGSFGLALYSRWPLVRAKVTQLGDVDLPVIDAEIDTAQARLRIIGVHLDWPLTGERSARRDQQLAALAKLLNESPIPSLAMGDFNTSPWSYAYRQLRQTTHLHHCVASYAARFSWPSFMPLLGIPIDHCLSNSAVLIDSNRYLFAGNSDHYPLSMQLRVAKTSATETSR